jgi:DNA-binding CsgD family transcriptional regulator
MVDSKLLAEIRETRKAKVNDVTKKMKLHQAERQKIVAAMRGSGSATISELARKTGLSPSSIVKHMLSMRKFGLALETGICQDEYSYRLTSKMGER